MSSRSFSLAASCAFSLLAIGLARAESENASQEGCLDASAGISAFEVVQTFPLSGAWFRAVANDSGRSPVLNGEPGTDFRVPVF